MRLTGLFLILLAGCLALTGCQSVPRQRTLPPSVRNVAVPMVINRSAEPGLEELTTVFTQEEFLADGRLQVVSERNADAVIEITIMDFVRRSQVFDIDDFARTTEYKMDARVKIARNMPGKPLIGPEREVTASTFVNSDTRRVVFEPEPVGIDRVARAMARAIVLEVLTGEAESVILLAPDQVPPQAPLQRPAAGS